MLLMRPDTPRKRGTPTLAHARGPRVGRDALESRLQAVRGVPGT